MPTHEALRDAVCAANLDLVRHGLVVVTWGNASGIDREAGVIAIKPSGVSYADLGPDSMVLVDMDGNAIEGDLRPSSDLPTHLALYHAFPRIGSVVHTHSTKATAFAQACQPIPCLGTTHADHFLGPVPVTRKLREDEVVGEYETNTAGVIVEAFEGLDPMTVPAVLVAQHGPFTWGRSPSDAALNSVVLEAVAGMALSTLELAPAAAAIDSYLLDRHFRRKHGPDAYYGQQ